MVDIDLLEQLVDSMKKSVTELENSIIQKNNENANKLRTFIFDLHLQIKKTIEES